MKKKYCQAKDLIIIRKNNSSFNSFKFGLNFYGWLLKEHSYLYQILKYSYRKVLKLTSDFIFTNNNDLKINFTQIKIMAKKKALDNAQAEEILKVLRTRFEKNMDRHPGVKWEDAEKKIMADPGKLWTLYEMEITGGEPDVIIMDKNDKQIVFCDCSIESPKDRRSLCYDRKALDARKEHKPKSSAMDIAAEIGIDILDEEQYRAIQKIFKFDMKTSSWVKTPDEIRKLGGAIFCDRRYDTVFMYHNGADSYYGARGFRGILKV